MHSSHAPAWEFSPQRSSVAKHRLVAKNICPTQVPGRWSVYACIPTPERGNDTPPRPALDLSTKDTSERDGVCNPVTHVS